MKSKQKYDQMSLSFSDDSQQDVSKQQESTTNSIVRLRESTKSETHGQIPTDKHCISCGEHLNEDNWYPSFVAKKHYKCNSCYDIRRIENRMKRGDKLSSKTLAKVYGKQTKAVYDQIKEGSVYILGNPAWPDWVKVGMALDAEDRLNNYQTGGPFRDYVLYYSYESKDRRKAESEAHYRLAQEFERRNEWFKCSPEEAIEVIHEKH